MNTQSRYRRNRARMLSRKRHGYLRRKDEWLERKHYDEFCLSVSKYCRCEYDVCDSVLCGAPCEERISRDDDYEDFADADFAMEDHIP